MTMRKVAQRIPFTPSKTQAALLEQCFGARRFAYNQQVEAFNTYDGELDADGRPTRNGQSRKRAMNRSILREGWSALVGKLSYKAEWYGRTLVRVDRFYPSSKLCHDCGHKYKELRLHEREWTCEQCGTPHDRDVNAALNILGETMRLSREKV